MKNSGVESSEHPWGRGPSIILKLGRLENDCEILPFSHHQKFSPAPYELRCLCKKYVFETVFLGWPTLGFGGLVALVQDYRCELPSPTGFILFILILFHFAKLGGYPEGCIEN